MQNKLYLKGICLLALILFLSACGESKSDLRKYIAGVQEKPSTKIEPLPVIPPSENFKYSDFKYRSPFHPPVKSQTADGGAPLYDPHRPLQPLEGYSLDSLRLRGTLMQGKTMWAVIEAPDGKIYRVTLGNYIGKNYGQVVKIANTQIDVEEMVNVGKKWEKRPASIAVSEE